MKTQSLKLEFNYSVTEERNQQGPYLSVRLTPASEDTIRLFGADFVDNRTMLKHSDLNGSMSLWAFWLRDLARYLRGPETSERVVFIDPAGQRREVQAGVFRPH